MGDTIFALSSGAPPAAIAIIRISGPQALGALERISGKNPQARQAVLADLHTAQGEILDQAVVIAFPGPNTVTGEDLAELHCHGGRAIVSAVERELAGYKGLRAADPGEFTRRAFANGKIDLAEAEGLADLLAAETELQRRSAMAMAGGALSQQVTAWRDELLRLSAQVEAQLDFSDDDDVGHLPEGFATDLAALAASLAIWLERPRAERLQHGVRIVLAGPPNAGKSTLFNALLEDSAAITSPEAGTTRDVIERTISLSGVPMTFVDTAGLRDRGAGSVEKEGVARARSQLELADITLWLGAEGEAGSDVWEIEAQLDRDDRSRKSNPRWRVSAVTGENLDDLRSDLVIACRKLLPKPGEAALNARQFALIQRAYDALASCETTCDPLLLAEELRTARVQFDDLIGRSATEDMLDALFGRFCIGK